MLFAAEAGALKVTRVTGDAFRRVYQDLRLNPAKEYAVRYRVKVEGPGAAHLWSYSGDEQFRWDESKCRYAADKSYLQGIAGACGTAGCAAGGRAAGADARGAVEG